MSKKTFEVTANGNLMGEYRAEDKAGAIDECCRDAGYENLAESLEVTGGYADEFQAFEIDTQALIAKVEEVAGAPVFQDSYGSGIALVNNASYNTHRELAEAFELDIDNFHA